MNIQATQAYATGTMLFRIQTYMNIVDNRKNQTDKNIKAQTMFHRFSIFTMFFNFKPTGTSLVNNQIRQEMKRKNIHYVPQIV